MEISKRAKKHAAQGENSQFLVVSSYSLPASLRLGVSAVNNPGSRRCRACPVHQIVVERPLLALRAPWQKNRFRQDCTKMTPLRHNDVLRIGYGFRAGQVLAFCG